MNTFGSQAPGAPFNSEDQSALLAQLSGTSTLYNTYWACSSRGGIIIDRAMENTKALNPTIWEAGAGRIVHIITNASMDSSLSYFRGKAKVKEAIASSRVSYKIVRPTVIFSLDDIPINNIAWLLRRFPLFVVPGQSSYRFQPIFVEDLADIAVNSVGEKDNFVLESVGP